MSFLNSAINQVGRDMGKVVSNQIFKDAHSTPYRRIENSANIQTTKRRSNFKSEFDKAIDFQTSHRPSTLISKISGVYTVIYNEANYYISDGYLDTDESDNLYTMMERFNQKAGNICEILEIDEEANKKEIEQLTKIFEKTNDLFRQTLKVSAEGCENKKKELLEKAESIEIISFIKFVGYNTIWMGKYIRTGEKSLGATIFANIFSLLLFPFIHICAAIYGASSYWGEKSKREKLKDTYGKMAELEGKRAQIYLGIG